MKTCQNIMKCLILGVALVLLWAVPAFAEDVILPNVQVEVAGSPALSGDSFTFIMSSTDGGPMPDGSVNGQKEIVINGEGSGNFGILADLPIGEYRYTITQLSGSDSSYYYDQSTYIMYIVMNWKNDIINGEKVALISAFVTEETTDHKVSDVDNNGNLILKFVNQHADLATPTPTPILTATPTPVSTPTPTPIMPTPTVTAVPVHTPVTDEIIVSKGVLNTPEETAFSFQLEADNPNNPMPSNSNNGVKTVSRSGSGTVGFGAISFTQPGIYNYTVHELLPGGTTGGTANEYIYDLTLYLIHYEIQLNTTTQVLTLEKTVTYSGNTGADVNDVMFINEFISPTPTVSITATPTNTPSATPTATPTTGPTLPPGVVYTPVTANELPVSKRVVGDNTVNEQFTMILNSDNNAPMPAGSVSGTKTATVDGNGAVHFGPITYNEPGIFNYTVRESIQSAAGYTYDYTLYLVSVSVTADYNTGNLSVSRRFTIAGGNGAAMSEIIFTNHYLQLGTTPTPTPTIDPGVTPTPTPVVTATPTGGVPTVTPYPVMLDPPVSKKVTGNTPSSAATFTFEMRADNVANPMPAGAENGVLRAQVTGTGVVEFGSITFRQAGIYNYTIVEIINAGLTGYQFDYTMYLMSVNVVNVGGQLQATRTITAAGSDGSSLYDMAFRNIFTGDSSVTPTPTSGTNTPTPTPIMTTTPTVGTSTPTPTPIVTPTGGEATPSPTPTTSTATPTPTPTLEPGITATPVPTFVVAADPPVHKTIIGGTPATDSEFTFVMRADYASNPMPSGAVNGELTLTITGAAIANFGNITFTQEGSYNYTVYEQRDNPVNGYTYDTALMLINFTVTNVNNQLQAVRTIAVAGEGKIDEDYMEFRNAYLAPGTTPTATPTATPTSTTSNTPQPVSITPPPIVKNITGDVPTVDTTFTFLIEADKEGTPLPAGANGQTGILTVTILGDGSLNLGNSIQYTEPGTFYYTITEVNGSVEGYQYDTTEYILRVVVTEENGQLVPTALIVAVGTSGTVSSIVFNNQYTMPTPTSVVPTTTPTITPPPGPVTGDLNEDVPLWILLAIGAIGMTLSVIFGKRKRGKGL